MRRLVEEFDAGSARRPDEESALMPQPNMQQLLKQAQKMQAGHDRRAGVAQGRGRRGVGRRRHGDRQGDAAIWSSSRSRSTPTRSIPMTSSCSRTWCWRRSTRGCAPRRSWPRPRWAASPAAWAGWAARRSGRSRAPGYVGPTQERVRASRPTAHHRALQASWHRRPHRAAAGVPHPARRRRGGVRARRRDQRGQGSDRPVRGVLQPRRRAALPDLRRRAPRPRADLRRRGTVGRDLDRAHARVLAAATTCSVVRCRRSTASTPRT